MSIEVLTPELGRCDSPHHGHRSGICGAAGVTEYRGPTGTHYVRCRPHSEVIDRTPWLASAGYVRLRAAEGAA